MQFLGQATTPGGAAHTSETRGITTSDSTSRRIDLVRNGLVLLGLWLAYAAVRNITGGHFATAADNANSIIDMQEALGLPSEQSVQAALLDHTGFIRLSNLYYLGVHFPITMMFLAWTWWNHRDKFSRIRNALVVTTAAGLAIHVAYPLLPPRMMHGFVDTAKTVGPDPYALGVSGGANQLAAMPSLHVGWALLVAVSVIWLSSSRTRWLALGHPLFTLIVVVVTANHYWADAAVAIALVAAAWLLTRRSLHQYGHRVRRDMSVLRQTRSAGHVHAR